MEPRRLILHVGLGKSGTTALQTALGVSRSELADHGVSVPLSTRPAVNRVLLRPLGWVPGAGFIAAAAPDSLGLLADCLRTVAHRDILISAEDLAELDEQTASSVVGLARSMGFEVQLVVTARPWTYQLPSEYQQFLKHRMSDTFADFLEAVRDNEGSYGRHFRLRQDVAEVCVRWAAGVPPENVHIVVLPRRREDRDFLFTEMATILGVPSALLSGVRRDVNRSYGVVEAELYRRLNLELARLLPGDTRNTPGTYAPVRRILSEGALRRGSSPRILVPPDHLSWVSRESTRQVEALAERGYCVHGELDWLLPDPLDAGPPLVVSEQDLADAAIQTLARFAVRTVLRDQGGGSPAGHDGRPATLIRRWLGYPPRGSQRVGRRSGT